MNATSVEVRPFEAADRTSVITIWLRASRAGHPFLSDAEIGMQQQLVETVYLDKAEIWIASVGGRPAAFVGLIGGFVGALFVDADDRGKGLGTLLLRHAIRLKGDLSLEVYEQNRQATAFYLRHGFVVAGRESQDSLGLPYPVLNMERRALGSEVQAE